MAEMRRVLLIAAASAALTGATAGPASADILSDLGVSTEGLVTLPQGFDPLTNFDPLSIDMAIGLPDDGTPRPVDMTTDWIRNPPGTPVKKSSKAARKRKKGRRARR